MEITVLTDNFGVEISGFDCAKSMELSDLNTLKDLIQSKHFICFKNQNLDGNSLAKFTKNFGKLEAYPEKDKTKGKIEIFNVSNVSEKGEHLSPDDQRVILQKNNSRWHTDSSYRYLPASFSILYGQETLPKEAIGGQTEFSNMLLAYEDLPEEKKKLLEPLHQVHSYNDIRRLEPGLPELTYEEKSNFPPVTHPVIRVHPDRNFQKSLYFTSNTSLEIGGMSLEEGKKLHTWLVDYISQDKFCYKHSWEQNDLIMWDNRVLLHRVIPYDYAKYRRAMIRGTVEGTVPVLGPFSNQVREYTSLN
ncbi:MAG: TauD/TfdA dioxygenase family protein [Candidatus Puniceispirillales bacterium]|jgi:alpha-ketoglutarate-dependent taurine dioxygenase